MTTKYAIPVTALLLAVLSAHGIAYGQLADASDRMPVAQQNALVQKFCVTCHDDAKKIGRLTLEAFDAADPDPGLAFMLAHKARSGAFGAAGVKPTPDLTTEKAFVAALLAESAGSDQWFVRRATNPATQRSLITAGVVKTAEGKDANSYWLKLTCDASTREGEMQVAWSPADVASNPTILSAVVGAGATVTYKVRKNEGAIVLAATKAKADIPALVIPSPGEKVRLEGLFPGETVVFTFQDLPEEARHDLSACSNGGHTSR